MKNYIALGLIFLIISLSGSVVVTKPDGGQIINRGSEYEITWTDDIPENVKIELLQSDTLYQTIVSSTVSDGSYLWSVPFNIYGNYKVKITSLTDSGINGASPNDFEIAFGSLAMTSPAGGITLEMFDDYEVTWIDNIPEDVKISLYKNTTLITNFNTTSDGSRIWNFYTKDMVAGSDYRLKIESVLFGSIYSETGYFSIKGTNNVSGSVSGTWTEPNSPYVITDSIYIETANTLSINSNVKTKSYGRHNYFNVFGKLNANGSHDGKVIFKDLLINFNNSSSSDSSKIVHSVIDNSRFELFKKKFLGDERITFDTGQQTSDGGYIVVGRSGYDFILIKTDQSGNLTWSKAFGGAYGGIDVGHSVVQTSDGGYIIAGQVENTASLNPFSGLDAWLIKTDANGNMVWENQWKMLNTGKLYSVCQTTDGGYIAVGSQQGYSNSYTFRYSADGDGPSPFNNYGSLTEFLYSVRPTSDGGCIAVGSTVYFSVGGSSDVWLVKIDAYLNKTWHKVFGGTGAEYGYSLQVTNDGGYIIVGTSLIKTDSAGNLIWNKPVSGKSVDQTADGGYIVVDGSLNSSTLTKTDPDGNVIWSKSISGTANTVRQTADGGYIVFSTELIDEEMYILLTKTDSYGNIVHKNFLVGNNSKLILQNSIVKNRNGYGMTVENASPVISNNLFVSNKHGIKFINSSAQYVVNNTIADNDSIGLYFSGNSDPTLINNIIFGNGYKQVYLNDEDSDPDFYFNNIQGGQSGFGLGTGAEFTGVYESNINSDPLLADSTFAISGTSPCKNTGYQGLTNGLLGNLYIPAFDLSGSQRLCGEIDMGCYEYYEIIITPDSPTNVFITVNADTLMIDWDIMPDANSYLIYSSNEPYGTFDYLDTASTNSWNSAIGTDTKKFYNVVASSESAKRTDPVKPVPKKIKIKKIENMLR